MEIHNEPGKDRAVEFDVFLRATVGRDLRLLGTQYEYELVADGDLAGMISLGPTEFWLAHMACREGGWYLTKHHKHGWEFVIEAEDRSQVGRYSGGRWRPGGTILMADETRVDLRRKLNGNWNLRTPNSRPFAAIRVSRWDMWPITVTIRSLPSGVVDLHVVVLTACAVVSLESVTGGGGVSGAGGG